METTETIMHYSNNNPYATVPVPAYHTYASYHTPPYTLNYDTWSDINCSSNLAIIQMQQPQQHQQLRFPTPPITPPRVHTNPTELPSESLQVTTTATPTPTQQLQHQQQPQHQQQQQQRMSVIMKIGHDPNSPQHVSNIMPLLHSTSPAEPSTLPHNHHQQQQQQQQHHNDTPSSGNSSPFSNNDFVCDWLDCARYFDSLESLAAHVTQMHAVACTTDGLYYCKWTGCQRSERGFNARYKMLVHVRTHTKEKPHQCNLCDKRFSRAENLKIHIRSHSGEKPYICTFEGCNKAYSNSSDRFKHTRTHSMEKPYKCKVPGCQKRYTDPSSLRKHVKTFKHSQQIMVDSMHFLHSEQQTKQEYRNEEESHYLPLEDVEALSKHRHSLHLPYHLMPSSYTSAAFLEQQHAGAAVIPQQDTFCLAMEEMCHIKASIDCYKSSDRTASAEESSSMPYWLQGQDDIDSAESALYYKSLYHDHHHQQHHHHHHQTELTMELDLTKDKPLDLSLKRF